MSSAPESALTVAVRHAPSLAGGPLRLLNRALLALAEARRRGPAWRAELILDEGWLRRDDRCLLLLDAHGNPVKLCGPDNGRFDEHSRAALAAAARDTLPPTATVASVVDAMLPAAGADPLEAEVELWRRLLGPAGLAVRGRRASAAGPEDPADELAGPEITWYGPRHLEALRRFGLAPAAALAGEDALRRALAPPPPEQLGAGLERLRAELGSCLGELEGAVRTEEPRLYGAWCRLRRETLRGLAGFTRRVERGLRNRDGIRGARLRALAQGLRPYDGPQQDGLGLMAAAALFELDLTSLERTLPALAGAHDQGVLLVEAASGVRIS